MHELIANVLHALDQVNAVIWHDWVLYVVLGTGILFTVWTKFCQWRALTHGVEVIRGKYDRREDPGAINHFQALSAALSATVGLGNIGGVAVAIALGGPGAVFWMWMIGLAGMALKTTEVTLSMLYRNLDNPENPHGGPMFVAAKGFAERGLPWLGQLVGGIFCITLLISTITGGNMFQAWNVADVTYAYFRIPTIATGIILTILVGMVIIGGIKRIGQVAGKLVPFMCILYLLAAVYVLIVNAGHIPETFKLIFHAAFNPQQAKGAFIGASAGYAFLWGMKRALFSSEAGQGSSPIAHSAAKTDQPVREAVVAGLEPFIDTLVVCTLTSLVILTTFTWDRGTEVRFTQPPQIVAADEAGKWTIPPTPIERPTDALWEDASAVFVTVRGDRNDKTGLDLHKLTGKIKKDGDGYRIEWDTIESKQRPELVSTDGAYLEYKGATLTAKAFDRTTEGLGKWLVTLAAWLFALSTMISWSYYGEQGIVFLISEKAVMAYRVIYCLLILVATWPGLIKTDAELDSLTALGTGVMLWANIPIMLIFGRVAMRAYHDYMRRLDRGEFHPHAPPPITDVVDGSDVE